MTTGPIGFDDVRPLIARAVASAADYRIRHRLPVDHQTTAEIPHTVLPPGLHRDMVARALARSHITLTNTMPARAERRRGRRNGTLR